MGLCRCMVLKGPRHFSYDYIKGMFFSRRVTSLQLIILFACILALLIGKQMKDLYDKHQKIIRIENYNSLLDEMAISMKGLQKKLDNHSAKIHELGKYVAKPKTPRLR